MQNIKNMPQNQILLRFLKYRGEGHIYFFLCFNQTQTYYQYLNHQKHHPQIPKFNGNLVFHHRKFQIKLIKLQYLALYIGYEESTSLVTIFFKFGGPESKVVSDQLHDSGGILVLIFLNLVDVSNGIIEGLLGQLTGLAWVVLNLIVENGVVKGKTESDGVGGFEGSLGFLGGCFVSLMGVISGLVVFSSGGVFGDVSVIVSLHFVVEDLSLSIGRLNEKLAVNKVKDLIAVSVELSLNLGFVALEEADVLGSLLFLLLFNGGESSPGGSS